MCVEAYKLAKCNICYTCHILEVYIYIYIYNLAYKLLIKNIERCEKFI